MNESVMSPDAALPPVSLLETMRLEQGAIARLERHLARMRASAGHFGVPWREDDVRAALAREAAARPEGVWRVRLLVDAAGQASVAGTPHADSTTVWRVAFANQPVESSDWRLRHKTTAREPYDIARRGRPDVDDVLLWNERGEVTESTIANVVVEIDGVRCTPPLSSGLLAGVRRGELIESGAVQERVIARGMVARAERVWLVNSLRGWIEAMLLR